MSPRSPGASPRMRSPVLSHPHPLPPIGALVLPEAASLTGGAGSRGDRGSRGSSKTSSTGRVAGAPSVDVIPQQKQEQKHKQEQKREHHQGPQKRGEQLVEMMTELHDHVMQKDYSVERKLRDEIEGELSTPRPNVRLSATTTISSVPIGLCILSSTLVIGCCNCARDHF